MKSTKQFKVERRQNHYGMPDDWLIRETRKDHVNCCEFRTEEEAIGAAERWNNGDGIAVFETWIAPPEDADDSHRGYYLVHVRGTKWRAVFGGNWHEDASSARAVSALRDVVAVHGLHAVQATLSAIEPDRLPFGKHSKQQSTRLRALSAVE